MSTRTYTRLATLATALTLFVVVLGAYVRLTDAGLGCPDWPGCYGTLTVPRGEQAVQAANSAYPERPVETQKAWNEMLHRYVAGGLGLVILALAVFAWRRRRVAGQPLLLPIALLALLLFQAALGMWTVTLLLKPAIVTAHLLGGMTILALLWALALRSAPAGRADAAPAGRPGRPGRRDTPSSLRPLAFIGIAVLACQIALGGWTSTNYAALSCPDFPTCHGEWLPLADMDEAFRVWRGVGQDYEGGVLSHAARVSVHTVHRLGALVTFLYIGGLAIWVLRRPDAAAARGTAIVVGGLLLIQIGLGVANVMLSLPLWVAVAHNGVAAALLLAMVSLASALGAAPAAVPAIARRA